MKITFCQKKYYKLVSRILFLNYHLSGTEVTFGLLLPTLQRSRFWQESGEQPSADGIHGITAYKVYPGLLLPAIPVGSYPTFSPLSSQVNLWGRLFSVALSVPAMQDPAIHRCIALCCPDFPLLCEER